MKHHGALVKYRVIHKSLRDFRTRPRKRPLVKKKTWRDFLPIHMLLSAVSVLVAAKSSSEIPEGLMNNPVAKGQAAILVNNPVPLPLFHYVSHTECSGIEIGSPW